MFCHFARNVFDISPVILIQSIKTMRTVSRSLSRQNAIWMLLLVACDSETELPTKPKTEPDFFTQTELLVLPGSSIVIDLKSVIEHSFESVSITITQQPLNGTLTQLDPFLLKYTSENFAQGVDQFIFSAVLDNSSTTVGGTIYIFTRGKLKDFPCGVYLVGDYIGVSEKKTASVKPLINDRLCGVNSNVDVFIHLQPKFGEAVVSGDSIIYTPGPSFNDSDELVYGLSAEGQEVSYGIVSVNKNETFPISTGFTDIFFVNDSVGFISGGAMIFKTNDGGKHWKELVYPRGEFEPITIEEIFFLDSDIGFAAFSKCLNQNDPACSGGWLMTKDGGLSWKSEELTVPVTSIFFTSPSSGYLGTSSYFEDYWDAPFHFTILKTIDGGETWEQVVENSSWVGNVKIRFVNEEIGYAFKVDNIFSTTDGGKTWTASPQDGYVGSLAVGDDDVAFASINSTLSITTPSTIVSSVNGVEWIPKADFPYSILAHEFSPSGGLGVAVGISGTIASTETLLLGKTTDKGENWAVVPGDFHGYPWGISIPSENVAYILFSDKIIKYHP